MKTSRLLILALPLALLSVPDARAEAGVPDAGDDGAVVDPGPPNAIVDDLAAGLAVKEGCSCVFIVQQSDAYCASYGAPASYLEVHLTIDHAGNSVSGTFLSAKRTAHFVDGSGCTLDP